jgi:hypothetical protein
MVLVAKHLSVFILLLLRLDHMLNTQAVPVNIHGAFSEHPVNILYGLVFRIDKG